MQIYIIYRHYWPDTTSYARILKSIAERLASDGHEVTVFTAQPSYNDVRNVRRPWREQVCGVKIRRMPLLWERKSVLLSRIVNSGLFMAGSLLYGTLRQRGGLAITVSTPPVFMGFTAMLLSKLSGGSYIYHCQDLNPEVARLGGKFDKGLIYNIMMWAEKVTQRNADAVVVLSGDMKKAVGERGLAVDNVRVLNNFMLELYEEDEKVPEDLVRRPGEKMRVLFAGNHGVFQGLENVIDAAWALAGNEEIHFQFVGDGLVKKKLMERAGDLVGTTVFFHPYISVEVIQKVMEESDLGLITLAPLVYKYAYPSKMMTLLNAGLPVLAVVESESELARFVQKEEVGWVCSTHDAEDIASSIRNAYTDRSNWGRRREHCRAVAEKEFGLSRNLDKWANLVKKLGDMTF